MMRVMRSIGLIVALTATHFPAWGKDRTRVEEIDQQLQAWSGRRLIDDDQLLQWNERVEELAQVAPDDPRTWYWKGIRADRERDSELAVRCWKECVARPGNAKDQRVAQLQGEAATLLGVTALGKGNGQEAADWAKKGIDAVPSKVEAYQLLLDASFQQADFSEAEAALTSAVKDLKRASSEIVFLYLTYLSDRGRWGEIEPFVKDRRRERFCCPAAVHFEARLADRAGQPERAAVLHVLVSLNGGGKKDVTLRSEDWLSRRAYERLAHPETAPRDVIWIHDLVARYEISMRRGLPTNMSERDALRSAAAQLPRKGKEESLVADHLSSTLDLLGGEIVPAKPRWEAIIRAFPDFVPAWCRLAEIREVEGPEGKVAAQADRQRAKALEPDHPLVRDFDRLGVELDLADRGVLLRSVERFSPAERLGWGAGDRIIRVEERNLEQLSEIDRLRTVRLFSGGRIDRQVPRQSSGKTEWEEVEDDIPLLILD